MSSRSFLSPIVIVVVVLFFGGAAHVEAWHDGGHLLTTEIAYRHLDAETKREVDRLVSLSESQYPNHRTFVTMASWLDWIRSREPLGTKGSWHYTNIPYDVASVLSEKALKGIVAENQTGDVVYAINLAVRGLSQEGAGDLDKALMLRVLTHCVGDVHQPLHCTSRYSTALPEGDKGGNLFMIGSCGAPNLHMLWDIGAGALPEVSAPYSDKELQTISGYATVLETQYPPEYFGTLGSLQAEDWAVEGHGVAVTVAYQLEDAEQPGKDYLDAVKKVADERVSLAGYRLAALLNSIFGSTEVEPAPEQKKAQGALSPLRLPALILLL